MSDSNKQYFPHFDEMKGIAIILMVMGHVSLFTFGINPSSITKFAYFNMPLFFYISGYLAHQKYESFQKLGNKIIQRGMTLLIPYLAFICFYNVFRYQELPTLTLLVGGGGRYWFLYTLFFLSLFFMIYEYLIGRIKKDWLYVSMWIFPYCILIAIKVMANNNDGGGKELVSVFVNYYRYYLIGFLCRKYVRLNLFLFENEIIIALSFLAYILNWCFFNWHNFGLIFFGTLGAIILIQAFVTKYINEHSAFGLILKMIGKNSLGIYVIHYFFIPELILNVESICVCMNPFILHFVCSLLVAIPIISASLFVNNLISMNGFLSLFFFGRKVRKINDIA